MRFAICTLLFNFVLVNCTNVFKVSNNKSHIKELAENGSWGYAGRHAYVADNKLFFSYIDTIGNDWVGSFDFFSHQIVNTKVWNGDPDLHSAHPIVIRPDGRIQIFLDKGGYIDNNIYWKVSSMPYSIDSFSEIRSSILEGDIIQGRQFYPLVHLESGQIYLVINGLKDRNLRKTVLWTSPDGGDTWKEYYNLWGLGKGLKGNRSYTKAYLQNDYIHFVTARVGWAEKLQDYNIGRVEGIYYIKLNIKDKWFYRANGDKSFHLSDVPIYNTELFDKVWDWEKYSNKKHRALWSDLVADKDGNPYITFTVQKAVDDGNSNDHFGYWATIDSNGSWIYSKVSQIAKGWDDLPERKNYSISINPHNPNAVIVAVKNKELVRLKKFKTHDYGVSWTSDSFNIEPGLYSTVIVPEILDDSENIVPFIWLDGKMDGWRDYNTAIKGIVLKR